MVPDPHSCFDCGRPLDSPALAGGPLVRRCAECTAGIEAHHSALGDPATARPGFRGVAALGTTLPEWPTGVTLLALEDWGRFSELTFVEVAGPGSPPAPARTSLLGDLPPQRWTLTAAQATTHHGCGGGGGTPGTDRMHLWHSTIAPSLPHDPGTVEVRAWAPSASTSTRLDFGGHPLARTPARVEEVEPPVDVAPDCPSCGAPDELDGSSEADELDGADACPVTPIAVAPTCGACRSARRAVLEAKHHVAPGPERVLAVGALLGPLFGSELVVPAIVAWPTWFDLSVVGLNAGAWRRALSGESRWSAHDDRGRSHVGVPVAGSSGNGIVRLELTFVPELAPDARALTVTIPPCFDGKQRRATFELGARR
jgi:hypothetical protein